MTPGPCFRYPGGANQPGAKSMSEEDDRRLDRKFADIRIELEALRLMMNEIFCVALALYDEPASAVVAMRRHITGNHRKSRDNGHRRRIRFRIPEVVFRQGPGFNKSSAGRN
jgi:hypothetical protein